jgi:hypothetical protein
MLQTSLKNDLFPFLYKIAGTIECSSFFEMTTLKIFLLSKKKNMVVWVKYVFFDK